VARATGGRTLSANLALLEENARVAGQVAVALAAEERGAPGGAS
jgi:pseudouridine-5'-phosphate glycosidase